MNWQFSHNGDRGSKYFYATLRGIKIWRRTWTGTTNEYSFNPNGLIWWTSEQQIIKFLTF